jgi:ribonucleoside-triphosphate reductase
MSERISSVEACKKLVQRSLAYFHLPYITVTPTFSICPNHGYLSGEHEFCPYCDDELIAAKQIKLNQQEENNYGSTSVH